MQTLPVGQFGGRGQATEDDLRIEDRELRTVNVEVRHLPLEDLTLAFAQRHRA